MSEQQKNIMIGISDKSARMGCINIIFDIAIVHIINASKNIKRPFAKQL
jgi:hypothetical protein